MYTFYNVDLKYIRRGHRRQEVSRSLKKQGHDFLLKYPMRMLHCQCLDIKISDL